jgi:hypothetical protein
MARLLNASSVLQCPHGGSVIIVTQNGRAKGGGDFLVRESDTFSIVGCPFTLGSNLHPCVRVQWVAPASRSKVISEATLTEESIGLCVAGDGAAQGTVLVASTQTLVVGQ